MMTNGAAFNWDDDTGASSSMMLEVVGGLGLRLQTANRWSSTASLAVETNYLANLGCRAFPRSYFPLAADGATIAALHAIRGLFDPLNGLIGR